MIQFHSENIDFNLVDKQRIRNWLTDVISMKGFKTGSINYIFCNDTHLLDLNERFLKHDTLTDIITFDYSNQSIVSGDIYISIDRVRENAPLFQKTFEEELNRVIVHGVLHLCGLKDKTAKQSEEMRLAEDESLALLPPR